MKREKAVAVTKALNSIENFEMFMESVEQLYYDMEGDFAGFFEDELMHLMKAELANRKAVLEQM